MYLPSGELLQIVPHERVRIEEKLVGPTLPQGHWLEGFLSSSFCQLYYTGDAMTMPCLITPCLIATRNRFIPYMCICMQIATSTLMLVQHGSHRVYPFRFHRFHDQALPNPSSHVFHTHSVIILKAALIASNRSLKSLIPPQKFKLAQTGISTKQCSEQCLGSAMQEHSPSFLPIKLM